MKAIIMMVAIMGCVTLIGALSPPIIGSYTTFLVVNRTHPWSQGVQAIAYGQTEYYNNETQSTVYFGSEGVGNRTTMSVLYSPQNQTLVTFDGIDTCFTTCANGENCYNETCYVMNAGTLAMLNGSSVYDGPCAGGNRWNATAEPDKMIFTFCVTDDNIPLWYAFNAVYRVMVAVYIPKQPAADIFDIPSYCPCLNETSTEAIEMAVKQRSLFRPF